MTILRVVDFETTGEAPPAVVIESATCDLNLATGFISAPRTRFHAATEIPPEARAVHHIRLEDLAGAPPFDAAELEQRAIDDGVAAIVAHNIAFEAQWISPALPRICTYKAGLRVWPDAPSHANAALAYWLEDGGLIAIDRAQASPMHRAGPDAYVTALILKALFATGTTGKAMTGWAKLPPLMPRCPIGQYRGKPWADVDRGFLVWMTNQATMDADLKWNAQRELDRRDAPAPPPAERGPLL